MSFKKKIDFPKICLSNVLFKWFTPKISWPICDWYYKLNTNFKNQNELYATSIKSIYFIASYWLLWKLKYVIQNLCVKSSFTCVISVEVLKIENSFLTMLAFLLVVSWARFGVWLSKPIRSHEHLWIIFSRLQFS